MHGPSVDVDWREHLDRTVRRARELVLADEPSGIGQGGVARAAVAAVPNGGILVVGNSMPVRDVDLHVPASPRGITVLSQRGVAGIDGLISGAAGAAAATGRPTLLLLGDVSFQHDVGGLAAASTIETPLVVLVVNNGGGRLFELLPVRRLDGVEATFERFFLTPPDVSVAAAARAFGIPSAKPTDYAELEAHLADGHTTPGPTVVEVEVQASGSPAVRRIAAALVADLAADEGCFRA
jgi:2-succinyl-5-enolpyruvyl-6-hydroxy-3-cyclohexene-1-carboxylate synthase